MTMYLKTTCPAGHTIEFEYPTFSGDLREGGPMLAALLALHANCQAPARLDVVDGERPRQIEPPEAPG